MSRSALIFLSLIIIGNVTYSQNKKDKINSKLKSVINKAISLYNEDILCD